MHFFKTNCVTKSLTEHAYEEITNNKRECQETEILMPAISSEMYTREMDLKSTPKFNSVDYRVPLHVVKEKVNSPDQEVFQINASRSYETSPIEFDGSLRNSVIKQLENGHFKQPPVSIQEVAKSEYQGKDNTDYRDSPLYKSNSGKASHVRSNELNAGLSNGQHPVCIDCHKEIKR